ncbi:Uncharacterised protein [[Eubacterium] contortum]|uniref:Uncharacterized protein n=1 Tax=Faecalicatena contorta TaxID=39482 RepID=A0A174IEW2_9FIRM|nr:hypothetical protein [Faecalicatena contorta]CUO85744.1 Uncharacterised protein [[Eubacterium] contortum] [Faecalicatena contorta]
MTNEQIANAYAITKVLGSDLSFDEFQKIYSEYYTESINELNSRLEYAKCEAVERPF